jgi:hypothetical protein
VATTQAEKEVRVRTGSKGEETLFNLFTLFFFLNYYNLENFCNEVTVLQRKPTCVSWNAMHGEFKKAMVK